MTDTSAPDANSKPGDPPTPGREAPRRDHAPDAPREAARAVGDALDREGRGAANFDVQQPGRNAPAASPPPEFDSAWRDDARWYAREVQFVLVAWALLPVAWTVCFFIYGFLARKPVPAWAVWTLTIAPTLASLGWLAWTISRVLVIFLRADRRMRQLGYEFGAAHHVLRILDLCEEAEVRVACPPPRDELAVTPAWPSSGSEYTRPARALLAVGFPSRRRPIPRRRR